MQGNASAQLLPGPMQHEQLHQQSRIGIDAVPSSADDSSASNAEQACTTDDGDFERVMARFDDLAKQEAADEAVGTAGQFSHLEHIICCFLRHRKEL